MSHPLRVDPVRLAAMWERGETVAAIAETFAVSRPAVSQWARIMGLRKRQAGRRRDHGMAEHRRSGEETG